jgi:hypothetical protein
MVTYFLLSHGPKVVRLTIVIDYIEETTSSHHSCEAAVKMSLILITASYLSLCCVASFLPVLIFKEIHTAFQSDTLID